MGNIGLLVRKADKKNILPPFSLSPVPPSYTARGFLLRAHIDWTRE